MKSHTHCRPSSSTAANYNYAEAKSDSPARVQRIPQSKAVSSTFYDAAVDDAAALEQAQLRHEQYTAATATTTAAGAAVNGTGNSTSSNSSSSNRPRTATKKWEPPAAPTDDTIVAKVKHVVCDVYINVSSGFLVIAIHAARAQQPLLQASLTRCTQAKCHLHCVSH
jgi:hypothetical protein